MENRLKDSTIWPQPIYEGMPLRKIIVSYKPSMMPYLQLPEKLLNYLFYICKLKKLIPKSFETTIYIAVRYLLKTNRMQSMQLILLVSLMLATKIFDYFRLSVEELHEISNHEFTTKDIYELESNILTTLDFNIFAETQNKELRANKLELKSHSTVHQTLVLVLEMTSALIHSQKKSLYYETSNKVFLLYFYTIYTKDFRKSMLIRLLNPKFAICFILKISLIILTQCKGNFPQVLWIQQLFGFKSSGNDKKFDDDFDQIVMKLIDSMLGRHARQVIT